MRVLAAPAWSFGRDTDLLYRFRDVLLDQRLEVHHLKSDVDLNRTTTSFSGETDAVFSAIETMASLAFDRINLNSHVGAHSRTGALDLCPFVAYPAMPSPSTKLQLLKSPPSEEVSERLQAELAGEAAEDENIVFREVEAFGARMAALFDLPVFLYEKSERGRPESDLPSMRKYGFGGLMDRELNPDFGPSRVNSTLGVALVGVRDFVLSLNVSFHGADPLFVKGLTADVRSLRASGDHRFLGVVARPFSLPSLGLSQLNLNFTLPTLTSVDPVLEWIMAEALSRKRRLAGIEAVGAVRRRDLPKATRLPVRPEQIVDL